MKVEFSLRWYHCVLRPLSPLCGLFSFIYFSLQTVISILSVICLRVSVLSMLLHTLPKYPNTTTYGLQRPGQSSPVFDLTSARPYLMWLTARTKEPQWPLVTKVLGHPLATAEADRGKGFPGQGSARCHMLGRLSHGLGGLGWQWMALRAKPSPPTPHGPPLTDGLSFRLSAPPPHDEDGMWFQGPSKLDCV